MKAVSKLKFKLINVKGCISLLGEFLDIKWDLDFGARLEHKINMKLVNIFVPKEQKHVYAVQEFQRKFICLKAIEFKRIVFVFVLHAGKICKRYCIPRTIWGINNLIFSKLVES